MGDLFNLLTSLVLFGLGVGVGFLVTFRMAFESVADTFQAMFAIAIKNGDTTEEQLETILTSWKKNQQ